MVEPFVPERRVGTKGEAGPQSPLLDDALPPPGRSASRKSSSLQCAVGNGQPDAAKFESRPRMGALATRAAARGIAIGVCADASVYAIRDARASPTKTKARSSTKTALR